MHITVYIFSYTNVIVRMLLLTMTNPNQMREMLLFVCSMVAD